MSVLSRLQAHVLSFSNPPAAQMPPTTAPMEHPVTDFMEKPWLSKASMTPICAYPLAPPLDNTKATDCDMS